MEYLNHTYAQDGGELDLALTMDNPLSKQLTLGLASMDLLCLFSFHLGSLRCSCVPGFLVTTRHDVRSERPVFQCNFAWGDTHPWGTKIILSLAIPEAHHEGAKWSREPSTFRVKSLRAGEKNPHKLYIVRMLNACTLGWC